jgi:hypothetical protein
LKVAKLNTPNPNIHELSLLWLGLGIPIKSGGVEFIFYMKWVLILYQKTKTSDYVL